LLRREPARHDAFIDLWRVRMNTPIPPGAMPLPRLMSLEERARQLGELNRQLRELNARLEYLNLMLKLGLH
jgi:hypothetical protein